MIAAGGFATSAAAQQDGLAKRVQQLEEQLVDMQVTLGTLQTMPSGGGQAPAGNYGSSYGPAGGGFAGGGSTDARLDGIETQIQALTAQMQQLSDQVRALANGRRGAAPDPVGRTYANAPQSSVQSESLSDAAGGLTGFGTTTVEPAGDSIGNFLSGNGFSSGGGDPRQMYEKAYGYMLQQNYGAAAQSFQDFLSRFPSHELAGNAQYWLGESHYMRGEYKTAASAFLEGYEKHRTNAKAPDNLLKLAMSLDRLGQKQAACSSYTELNAQFPNAPEHVRRQAATERRRAGC